MALSPYDLCPCGSGKQFKWCCQAINPLVERAYDQHDRGQHEAAVKTLQEVVAAHSDNPEAHGRYAQMLYQLNQVEEAEATLDRAFQINPNYPYGHFLRGQFRNLEGDVVNAAALFRRAAALYHPGTHDTLAVIYGQLTECEVRLNRPVAARAALDQSIRHDGTNDQLRKLQDELFGEASPLPLVARKPYSLQSLADSAPAERRAAWKKALEAAATGKLSDERKVFEELSASDDRDPAACFNLALTQAWLGDNAAALESLERYLDLEPDETKAVEAATLAAVLRCGQGLEQSDADVWGRVRIYRVLEPQRLVDALSQLTRDRLFVGANVDQQRGVLSGLLLEKPTVLAGQQETRPLRIGAHLLFDGGQVQLANADGELFAETLREFAAAAGSALGEFGERITPAQPLDLVAEAIVFSATQSEEEARRLSTESFARYFEDRWIHQPLRSLRGIPPTEAAGSRVLRRKLLGAIEYLAQCAALRGFPYDFAHLRRKLGLLETPAPTAPAAAPTPATEAPAIDIAALGVAELEKLPLETLSEAQLEEAWQTAQKLEAAELAVHFLKTLVGRPVAERKDRFPWFTALVARAQREGDGAAALDLLNEGEKFDCEHNSGQRRNDYELRRAQIHARSGEIEAAADVFDRLIARVPEEARYRSSAAEAMLSVRQGARALKYAEGGLALARKQNNRDSEGHFLELVAAARKQGG